MAKKTSTALTVIDQELAEDAAAAAGQVASISSTGAWVNTNGGEMKINDAVIPRVPIVVLASTFVYDYQDGPRTQEFTMPSCFAIGEVGAGPETLAPHDGSSDPQGDDDGKCKGCAQNQFGSASTGKGKACRNRLRLAFLQAGTFDDQDNFQAFDTDEFKEQQPYFIVVPTTSLKGWTGHVNGLKTTLNRGPSGVITEMARDPEPQHLKLDFTLIEKIPTEWWDHIKKLRTDQGVISTLTKPYEAREEPAAGGGGQRRGAKPAPQRNAKPAPRNAKPAPRNAPARGGRF